MNDLERYGHGGDIWSAASAYGGREERFLDYSANINPLGPPSQVLRVMNEAIKWIIRYPDPGHRDLKQKLAARLGVDAASLLIGNGAAECMALLLLAVRPAKVGIVEPCFSEYAGLSRQYGAEVISLVGNPNDDYRVSAEQLEGLMAEVDLCFIGHPNNPTGVLYDANTVQRTVEAAERCGTVLAVDEAFIDFLADGEERSVLSMVTKFSNLVVFRSLTKFYAIPGLRLGYAIAGPDRIKAMTGKQVAWSVNGLALAAGEAMFDDDAELTAYEQHTRELIASERQWLSRQLKQLGLRVWPSEVNYLLCKVSAPWTAGSLQTALGQRGVLIRSCAMYNGLSEGHFRLAVKDRAANAQLIRTMRQVFEMEG
ncbi:threonine-phosphate decarboxylase CobD [Paenibacillus marinisediminis]